MQWVMELAYSKTDARHVERNNTILVYQVVSLQSLVHTTSVIAVLLLCFHSLPSAFKEGRYYLCSLICWWSLEVIQGNFVT